MLSLDLAPEGPGATGAVGGMAAVEADGGTPNPCTGIVGGDRKTWPRFTDEGSSIPDISEENWKAGLPVGASPSCDCCTIRARLVEQCGL